MLSGENSHDAPPRSPDVIWRGSRLNPSGRLFISKIQSPDLSLPLLFGMGVADGEAPACAGKVSGKTAKAILVISVLMIGLLAPERVSAESEGATGRRKAFI